MEPAIQLLARARAADVARLAERRRLDALVATCRRRVLGIFPIDTPCTPTSAP